MAEFIKAEDLSTIMLPKPIRRSTKPRTSPLWKMFKLLSPGLARCFICRKTLSFKSSNSNLKRHLQSKHYAAFEKLVGHVIPQGNKASETHRIAKNLIALVQTHSCLWDARCDSYGDAQQQHDAWNSIASELYPMEEHNRIVPKISQQFNTLRNGFLSNRRCSYSKELSFMMPLLDAIDEEFPLDIKRNGIEIKQEVIDEYTSNKDSLVYRPKKDERQSRFREKNECNNELPMDTDGRLKQNIQQDSGEGYEFQKHLKYSSAAPTSCDLQLNNAVEDNLFLLSLVDVIRKVPEEFEINFKAELLAEFSKQLRRYEDASK